MERNLSISVIAPAAFLTLLGLGTAGGQTQDKISAVDVGSRQSHASLKVRVTDPTNARIPDATVIVVNAANRVVANGQTDSIGEFQTTGIAPGSYSVRVMAFGFNKGERQDLVVSADMGTAIHLISVRLNLAPTSGPVFVFPNIPFADPIPDLHLVVPDLIPLVPTGPR